MLNDVQPGEKRLYYYHDAVPVKTNSQNLFSLVKANSPSLQLISVARPLHVVAARCSGSCGLATASRCTVWATLVAEPPGGCRKRAELVAEDGGAYPNEREATVQAAATGGATISQHGHRMHEEVSVDVVVLQ
jgi:hypothetical protein